MSLTSLDELSTKNVSESSSQNNTSVQTSIEGFSLKNSALYTGDLFSISLESTEKMGTNENGGSSTASTRVSNSPTLTAVNSVDEEIEPTVDLSDIETANKSFSTGAFDSFTSHTLSIYGEKFSSGSKKMIEAQSSGDLYLPLAEEQDTGIDTREKKDTIGAKAFAKNGEPTEMLISAIEAFKEASQNQCNLVKDQTSAINRLAAAIEDQNLMLSRFNTVVQRSGAKNYLDNDETLKKHEQ